MTRFFSISGFGLVSLSSLGLVLAAGGCSSDKNTNTLTSAAGASGRTGGPSAGSPGGTTAGGPGATAGNGGVLPTGGSGGAPSATAGSSGTGGSTPVGTAGGTGTAGSGGGGDVPVNLPPLATSNCPTGTCVAGAGFVWKADGTLTDSTAAATVTVNDTATAQTWEGFGAAFNEIGWNVLTTSAMQTQALKLLFSATDGANFLWGRVPMGASDYAISRYTLDDTGTDVTPNGETNRPAADTALAKFSLDRDGQKLIPYIKAAQAVKPGIRFWASPWTPPVWMKTGFLTGTKPSFFDGGTVTNSTDNLKAYAQYYKKFVEGYKAQGINIELVSPQNEPGYEQNYPSALWDKTTYVAWVNILGPVMKDMGVKVMLGTLSNNGDKSRTDLDIASAVLADATAKTFVTVAGVQWGILKAVVGGTAFGSLPIWATEHKCGNYPWCSAVGTDCPQAYDGTKAPNDEPYGEETWGYIRDAITKGKVTSYSAWNMVLDKNGLGNDTTRDWRQDALLVADSGAVTPTAAYYVFRHFSQYVVPGAQVVGTTGGDAVAFKNPDGSLVAVMFNSGAANANYVVAIGGKKYQFAMPAKGWATVKVKP